MTDSSNPAAQRAHALVARAIKRGDLLRQPCEECGEEPTDAHHDDYSRPLGVRWLCPSHHQQLHGRAACREFSEKVGWGDDFFTTKQTADLIGFTPTDLYAFHDQLETVSNGRHRIYRASSVQKLVEKLDSDLDAVLASQRQEVI